MEQKINETKNFRERDILERQAGQLREFARELRKLLGTDSEALEKDLSKWEAEDRNRVIDLLNTARETEELSDVYELFKNAAAIGVNRMQNALEEAVAGGHG